MGKKKKGPKGPPSPRYEELFQLLQEVMADVIVSCQGAPPEKRMENGVMASHFILEVVKRWECRSMGMDHCVNLAQQAMLKNMRIQAPSRLREALRRVEDVFQTQNVVGEGAPMEEAPQEEGVAGERPSDAGGDAEADADVPWTDSTSKRPADATEREPSEAPPPDPLPSSAPSKKGEPNGEGVRPSAGTLSILPADPDPEDGVLDGGGAPSTPVERDPWEEAFDEESSVNPVRTDEPRPGVGQDQPKEAAGEGAERAVRDPWLARRPKGRFSSGKPVKVGGKG